MTAEPKSSVNPLEQYMLLARGARGAAVVELLRQCMEAPGVYVFGELLDMPSVQQLETTHADQLQLLKLFAYGTYTQYKAEKASLPELSPLQMKKLRHLTIVSLATENKCLSYDLLLRELDLRNLRELEDLIIEVIYADIIRGKLDQKQQQLEVDYTIGRDIRPESLDSIVGVLQEWCNGCESMLQGIETQVSKANQYRDTQQRLRLQVDQEVTNIKKMLKTSQQQDIEEQMVTDSRDATAPAPDKSNKKSAKSKSLRGTAKLFGKSS